ncbi:hypothetical protein O181_040696 [Austropuccinia psidii MF-1]|uniref:Uncharacterized protein n=1 Tax=Austropuccinia psidii MF-1 TaxID=1389203 RepID=A0A9Q3HDM0_9BASI|nr:hypothetical protein [Austropuccinia psidii MF-1]
MDIMLNVEIPYPPLLRRPAYPASPRAREALESHIDELVKLGVLRKVGHNEEVEVTTPVIITWHNDESRVVGDFRVLKTYTIPNRYPIPRIHVSQPQRMTLLYWCCGNSNLRPSWGQLATRYLYCQFGPFWCSMAFWPYHSSLAFDGLRPYSAILGLPGQFFHIPNPQGLNGLFGPFRPPTASTVHSPWSVGQLGPFWPNPMRPKGDKGGRPLAPKARWVPNHNWAHLIQISPQMAINHHRTTMDHFSAHGPWYPQEATRSAQLNPPPHLQSKSSTPPCTPYSRLQEWCIYGIVYHYVPFLLSNSMVTFSVQNSMFPNQGPKIQLPFQRRTFYLISLAIYGGNQKTIQGSQSPGPAGVGLAIHSGLFQGPFSEVIHYFNQFSRHQVFQYSLDNSIGPYRRVTTMEIHPLGPQHGISMPYPVYGNLVISIIIGQIGHCLVSWP